jgi:hypothetical protein
MNRLKAWSMLVLFLAFSAPGLAQTYEGRILGTVTDKLGGTVKDAKVTITNVDTGVPRSLTTNEAGDYVAPSLPPGVYSIIVEATGFKRVERLGVRLEVAKDVRIDFVLVPGDIRESIRVTEEAPLVETTNDTLGGTFANKAINDLPLNGRDYQNLVVLRPGVQRSPGGGFLSISSNGNRPEDNNFIFDGIDNNDPYYGSQVINVEGVQGTPGSILPIDAIQEFNAVENPPAEYGWKPGAIVNLGIKSGTNEVHGTTYYFGRNDNLDARNFFNTEIDPNTGKFAERKELRQHQFGGTLGGPIRKNKTFIFGGYEGVRALVGNTNLVTVPATAGGLPTPSTPNCTFIASGDCGTSIIDALTDLSKQPGFTIPAGTCGGAPVTKNSAGQLSLNPLSANLLGCGSFTGNGPFPGLFPINKGTSVAGPAVITTGFPNVNRMDAFVLKGDHHFNDQHSLSIRYFFGDSLQTEQDIPVVQPQWESQSQLRAQVVGANYIWVPNARWVNELKFGYNRFWQAIFTADHNKNPVTTYGINTGVTDPINFGMPTIIISPFNSNSPSGLLGGNKGWPLLTTPNETYQFVDNVSYTHGRHTFRFGGEFRLGKTDNLRHRQGKGRVKFNRGGNAFSGVESSVTETTMSSTPLEDFLAGNPDTGDIFVGNAHRNASLRSFGAFVQDDWRVTPRFTINAGVRYDLTGSIRERRNLLGNFDPRVGLEQLGINIGSLYNVDYKNVGPRLGLAWDPWGKGKTVIRAGGSIIYEYPHMAIFLGQNGINNDPATIGVNAIPTAAIGSNIPGTIFAGTRSQTINWSAAGPVFSLALDCSPATGSPCDILGVTRNLRTPYVITWNLNIQQTIGNSTSVQIGYVGNRGVQLYSVRDINQVDPNSPAENSSVTVIDPVTGAVLACNHCEQAGRPFNTKFPFLGFINFLENGYTSIYHGLQASVTRRVWHGLTFVGGYTWAHAIDDVSLNRAPQPQNSFNPKAERGNSDLDIRHRFTLALTYDLPSHKGFGQLLEGWQVNSIVVLQGGTPYNPTDFENDVSLTGEFSDRWNLNGDPRKVQTWSLNGPLLCSATNSAGVCTAYLNGLLTMPGSGTFGNAGRNIFRGPGYRNWDFSLVKTQRLTEHFNMQIRGEFFNVLNHPNFGIPGSLLVNAFNNDLGLPNSLGLVPGTPDVIAANPVIGTGGPRNIQLGVKFRF